MTARLLASCSPGEIRVAVLERDILRDYAVWRPGASDGVGDLHRGRLSTRVPAMAGAFVALEHGHGFLPDSAGAAGRTEGEILGVRATRAPQGGKGPRLTARLTPDEQAAIGDGLPRRLRRGPGAIERLAALWPQAACFADDPLVVAEMRQKLGDRVAYRPRVFEPTVEQEIAALAEPKLALPGGMTATITPTPALVAVDVDGGAATNARTPKLAAQLAANLAAIPALAAAIRLRNLGGAILIDFAGLPAKRRAALAPALAAGLADDWVAARLIGFTGLGLAEILRPRIHPPLHEMLAGPHAAGLAALRGLAREAAASPGRKLILRAAPAIVHALRADPAALPALDRVTTHRAGLLEDAGFAVGRWRIEDA